MSKPRPEPEEAGEPLAEEAPGGIFLEIFYGAEPPADEGRDERSA